MKRVSWCLSSISRISHSSIELSLYARNIVSHLFKKEGKKKEQNHSKIYNKNNLYAREQPYWLI